MAYSKNEWVDNTSPYLNATNLNQIEVGIYNASAAGDNNLIKINENSADILENAQNISNNTSRINTNVADIDANKVKIHTNISDIQDNTNDIIELDYRIETNATDIQINADNILALSVGEVYKGTWTPQLGIEYPASPEGGWSYYIQFLDDDGYEFETGSLLGRTANNGDKIIYNGTEWSMLDNTNEKLGYYMVNDIESMIALSPLQDALCEVYGYHIANDGGGGTFNYDINLSHINNGGTVIDGWVRQCDYGTANVRWFGATGDGVTDDSAAFQSAFDAIRYLEVTAEGEVLDISNTGATVKFIVPPGGYVISTSIDMTGMRESFSSWYVEMAGAVIFGRTVGKTVFDLLNSRRCVWSGGTIIGEESYLCRTGVQIGRDISTDAANGHNFDGLDIKGFFSLGCLHNVASEGLVVVDMSLKNSYATDTSYALVQDGESYFGAVSDYVGVIAQNTPQSFLRNTFVRLDARKLNTGSAVWMGGTNAHTYLSLYVLSYDASGIVLHNGVLSQANEYLKLEMHVETNLGDTDPNTGCKYGITFTATDTQAGLNVHGLELLDHKPHCGVAMFNAGTNVDGVVIFLSDVTIGDYGQDSGQKLFNDVTKFRYSGTLSLGSTKWQLDDITSFNGTIHVNDAEQYLGIGSGSFQIIDKLNTLFKNELTVMAKPNNVCDIRYKDAGLVNRGHLQYSVTQDKHSIILDDGSALRFDPLRFYTETAGTYMGTNLYPWARVYSATYYVNGTIGATGSFTSSDGKTITVDGGIITGIV